MDGRWKVACINWGHSEAPRALTYFLPNDGADIRAEHYWPTWAEAVTAVATPRNAEDA